MVSLACQCFNNEYAYAVSPAEQATVEALRRRLEEQLATGDRRGLGGSLATYAMHAPLWTLHADMRILEMSELQSSPDFGELIARQVREHSEEEAIRKEVASFGMSGEPVTDAVRQQYEASPYPRWLGITIRDPVRYADEMARRFPFLGLIEIDSPVRILIAGCGTGYHAIQVAAKYSDATVLAIDISKASLAHAIRQARRYGVSNIEFLHGDLLRIERLGKQFDVVESVGVLHHLADPIAGFRALTNVLAPGGFMQIGLYSRRARLGLAPAQRLAKSRNIGGSPDELRLFRQEVIATECDEGRVGLADISDFFCLSGFRDLICHVQELQFTPAELKVALQNVNVSMLGYRVDARTLRAYRERFPEDPDMRDFELVDRFEADHPDMFANLPKFWLRKNAG
jgi:SAM-dependent methyltransferase